MATIPERIASHEAARMVAEERQERTTRDLAELWERIDAGEEIPGFKVDGCRATAGRAADKLNDLRNRLSALYAEAYAEGWSLSTIRDEIEQAVRP